jgi:hypothetical protein
MSALFEATSSCWSVFFRWEIHGATPAWETEGICKFLKTLPALEDFQLDMQGSFDLPLPQLSGLKKFALRNHINNVYQFNAREPPTMQKIYLMIAQNRLLSCTLDCSGEWSGLWSKLRSPTRFYYIPEISTNLVTPDLFAYLAASPGLRELNLICPAAPRLYADERADFFFDKVLPRHSASLVEFSCPAGYESRWSFGPHNADAISTLRNLTMLHMSVNAGKVEPVRHVSFPLQMSVMPDIGPMEADQAAVDCIVVSGRSGLMQP